MEAFIELTHSRGNIRELSELINRFDLEMISRRELQDAQRFLEFYNAIFIEAIKARKVEIVRLLVIDSYELLLNYKVDSEIVKQLLNENRFKLLNLLF